MAGFDGWDARYIGDAMALPGDELMHFRTKGSKNGVRRYQQEDGTWTPLGLKLRKAREGWGETKKERKANKAVAKKEKQAAKAEKKVAKKEARHERMLKRKEFFKSNSLKGLSDAEVRKKIARAKMEKEYKELTRSHAVETGLKAAKYLLDARIKADKIRSEELTKQEKERSKQAASKVRQMHEDRKAGLRISRKADLKRAKKELKESSAWNKMWTIHKEKRLSQIRQKEDVNKGMNFVKSMLKGENAIRRHNAFRKKDNRLSKQEYDTPLKEAQRKLESAREQTKQAGIRSTQTKREADKAKYESQTAASNAESARYGFERAKLGNSGSKKKKK